MERLKIQGAVREAGKKGVNRRLRREGSVPAVLYGRGGESLSLAVGAKEFTTVVRQGGTNALIDLELGQEKGPVVVMLKDFQADVLTHRVTHIDFVRVSLQEKVEVKIPLRVVGKSEGVTKGGLIELARRELEVRCLPGNIPEAIDVDISPLDIGHSLHVRDLKLPEGVEWAQEGDFTVISIVAPREEEAAPAEAAPAEAAAAPAAGEGAQPPTAGGAEPAKAEGKGEKK